ncbi:hypothetical protein MUK42_35923 [Musa troglodytarum]|uniref:Uncharacterized protein n=1 Tax=Musa troglodytarum TaxID=320322 RepID=A0A9E7FWV7_9LILI|nr:hypothetical protein MUK42_35923 [Musa troglodytarum]
MKEVFEQPSPEDGDGVFGQSPERPPSLLSLDDGQLLQSFSFLPHGFVSRPQLRRIPVQALQLFSVRRRLSRDMELGEDGIPELGEVAGHGLNCESSFSFLRATSKTTRSHKECKLYRIAIMILPRSIRAKIHRTRYERRRKTKLQCMNARYRCFYARLSTSSVSHSSRPNPSEFFVRTRLSCTSYRHNLIKQLLSRLQIPRMLEYRGHGCQS